MKKIFVRNYLYEELIFKKRILIAICIIFLLTSILVINLFYLQIIHFEKYCLQSNRNRIRYIPIIPNRGNIYDKNGIPLTANKVICQLHLIPNKIKNLDKTIHKLRSIIFFNENDIKNIKKNYKYSSKFMSFPIRSKLNDVQEAKFSVNQYRFPELKIKKYQYRYYPFKSLLTHIIGFVSKINSYDIKELKKKNIISNYTINSSIGKIGIERYYENILRGRIGFEKVEINNKGKIIRKICQIPPKNGCDIFLTIDIRLQKYIETLLHNNRSAVLVANPKNGNILALVSIPSYDPNLFVRGISNIDYRILIKNKDNVFINRTIQGVYPPASTVKPYISIAALTTGIIKKDFSLFDPGWWKLPGSKKKYRDWKKNGHGSVNVIKALEESSDTFFYQIAYDMGIDKLSKWMTKFGYGKKTGIDLVEEKTGVMPNREWKRLHFNKPWYQGDTIPIGIGQGYWTATPLQMLNSLMILINNGIIHTPHLLYGISIKNTMIFYKQKSFVHIGAKNSEYWNFIKDGMYGVANRKNGTARDSFYDSSYEIAAKSGTAQLYSLKKNEIYNSNKVVENLRDHKLMTAFAPFCNPKLAIVTVLENGGDSKISVGNITRKIIDFAIKNKIE